MAIILDHKIDWYTSTSVYSHFMGTFLNDTNRCFFVWTVGLLFFSLTAFNALFGFLLDEIKILQFPCPITNPLLTLLIWCRNPTLEWPSNDSRMSLEWILDELGMRFGPWTSNPWFGIRKWWRSSSRNPGDLRVRKVRYILRQLKRAYFFRSLSWARYNRSTEN